MAAKKKVAEKAIARMKAAEVFIQVDGTPFVLNVRLDGKEKKHPSKVFWQAVDITQSYKIVPDYPPKPFKKVPDPFLTVNGTTATVKVDKQYANGRYGYTIYALKRSQWIKTSGGGIIIDS